MIVSVVSVSFTMGQRSDVLHHSFPSRFLLVLRGVHVKAVLGVVRSSIMIIILWQVTFLLV